ncbi:MAG: chromosomal replication initiator protein DnaA, partial [Leptospiraceae bacterium]|nr:chromosomal replication initiator protein DnaA [Leptospiraceae bacterium]
LKNGESMNIEWNQVLEEISKYIPGPYYGSFISTLEIANLNQEKLILKAPSELIKNHVEKKYTKFIQDAVHKISGTNIQVEILLDSNPEHPMENFVLEKFKEDSFNFNPDYTMDNFILGESNCLAHTACMEIIENPGSLNPLYIYGGLGVGKTHLLQAVGSALLNKSQYSVKYLSITSFLSEFVYTIQNKLSVEEFRKKYYSYDAIIIDDIQSLNSSAEKTQDEFFALFNHLYERKRQILIGSDRPISELPLQDRLKSRLGLGNQVLIQPPDEKIREKVLDKKLKLINLSLSENSKAFICENFKNDMRSLLGALNELSLYKKTYNLLLLSDEKIQEILYHRIEKQDRADVTHDRILDVVCQYYSQEKSDILSKSRRAEYILPRHISMYLLNEVARMSKSNIGKLFSTNHTTVISAVKKVKEKIKADSNLKRTIDNFRSRFEFR